jgi:hypothetical protein
MIEALKHVVEMKEQGTPPFVSLFEDREPMPTAGAFYPRIFDSFTGPTFDDV